METINDWKQRFMQQFEYLDYGDGEFNSDHVNTTELIAFIEAERTKAVKEDRESLLVEIRSEIANDEEGGGYLHGLHRASLIIRNHSKKV